MSTLFDLIKESIGSNNFERVKLIAIKAHEQKMADIAEIYAEKGMELNGNDEEILYIRAKYAIKKKNYALAFDCLKTYKLTQSVNYYPQLMTFVLIQLYVTMIQNVWD